MADLEQIYRPGEAQTSLEPGEQLRYSFVLAQGKKNWLGLHYELADGVTYKSHLTNTRLILESNVRSAQGFFLLKTLVTGLSLAARLYGLKHASRGGSFVKSQLKAGESTANSVRNQTLSVPLDQISHIEKSFPTWLRLVLKDPPPDFDSHSLVFLAYPLPGRVRFKTGYSAAADVMSLFQAVLQDVPRDATIVS